MDYKQLGRRIYSERTKQEMTIYELCELIYISPELVERIEEGDHKINPAIFINICNALHSLPSILMEGQGVLH